MQTLHKKTPTAQDEKIALRTMNFDSVLGAGPFKDLTIGRMIELKMVPYLRVLYYANSNVNFIPEILKIIGVTIIVKPGINSELAKAQKQLKIPMYNWTFGQHPNSKIADINRKDRFYQSPTFQLGTRKNWV